MEVARVLYHVTKIENTDSIFDDGLLPHYAQGKLKVTWLVDFERSMWAVAHTAQKFDVSPDRLVIFSCVCASTSVKRWKLRGVWTCAYRITPRGASGAMNVIMEYENMMLALETEFQERLAERERQLHLF